MIKGYEDLTNNWDRKSLDANKRMLKELFEGGGIPVNGIGTNELKKNAVETDNIKDQVITAPKIAPKAIGNYQLADGNVNALKLSKDYDFVQIHLEDVDPRKLDKNGRHLLLNNTYLPSSFNNRGIVYYGDYNNWKTLNLTALPITVLEQKMQEYFFRWRGDDSSAKINWTDNLGVPDAISGLISIKDDSVPISNLTSETRTNLGVFKELELKETKGFLTYGSLNVDSITPNDGYRTLVADCEKGQVFNIDTHVNNSSTSSVIFWGKDGKYLSDLDRGSDKKFYNYEVPVPADAKKFSITSVWAGNPPLKPVIRKFEMNDTNSIKTEIKDVSDRLLSFEKKDLSITNGFLTYASPNVNSITANSGYRTIVTEVNEGEVWNVDTTLNNLNTSAVCFWNEEGKFLGDLERGGKGTLEWYKFKIPPNVKTISTSSLSSGVTPVFRKGESTDLLEIDKRVSDIEKEISGKETTNILSVGDSTIGNYDDASSVTQQIARFLSASVTNVGFGGCRMGKHAQYWDAFSFYRLMAELVKDNSDPTKWKIQDEAIAAGLNGTWSTMPGYFPSRLERLKKVDMNKINILTIGYGQNDYTGGNPIDNLENLLDINTFCGALRYGLSKFMAKFPHIKVLIYTPTYRIWFNEDKTFKEDSDTIDYAETGTLPEYVDKEIEVAKEFKVSYLDSYRNMGVNKYNYSIAFTYPDGVHHDGNGRKLFGEMIAKKLLTL